MKRESLLGSVARCGAAMIISVSAMAAEKTSTPHQLRILAVGSRAPFKQELRDGVRYEIDPPAGSLPPREIQVGVVDSEGEPGDVGDQALRLRLGEPSSPVAVPAPNDPDRKLILRDDESGLVWLKPALSPGSSTMLLVWRAGKTWSEAKSRAFDDSSTAVPPGNCRVINVSPANIGVTWGDKRIVVRPGKQHLFSFPSGASAGRIRLQYAHGEEFVTLMDTEVGNDSGMKRQFVVFRSDQADARQPIQVIPLVERR
ncbi:hypothetical protein ACFQY0_11575 [Haloferula chungangensis]|uniref:Uncharacterized protein n=1 Tax=Haloferula chungangensis TaxID=1048331 RepID=A0ABW2L8G4_9BACT